VPVGLIPIHIAVLGADPHVVVAIRSAAEWNLSRLEAIDDRVELRLANAKAIVLDRESFLRVDEVEREPVVQVHGVERSDRSLAVGDAEKVAEHARRGRRTA
jgi:hypothetical protein